jgi:hypothetical protein
VCMCVCVQMCVCVCVCVCTDGPAHSLILSEFVFFTQRDVQPAPSAPVPTSSTCTVAPSHFSCPQAYFVDFYTSPDPLKNGLKKRNGGVVT